MGDTIYEAISIAEELRKDHNGIGGVYLFLGHDGHNACELKDIDSREVGKGESGRTLLEAVQRAERDWRHRRVLKRRDGVLGLARQAAQLFALGADNSFGVFTTQNFQAIVSTQHCYLPTPEQVEQMLAGERCVVRLTGPHLWFVLPQGYSRPDDDPSADLADARGDCGPVEAAPQPHYVNRESELGTAPPPERDAAGRKICRTYRRDQDGRFREILRSQVRRGDRIICIGQDGFRLFKCEQIDVEEIILPDNNDAGGVRSSASTDLLA